MYPHTHTCFAWDRRDRLVCTPVCRTVHRRPWMIRSSSVPELQGDDTFRLRRRWTIFQVPSYQRVAIVDTFDEALARLNDLTGQFHRCPEDR